MTLMRLGSLMKKMHINQEGDRGRRRYVQQYAIGQSSAIEHQRLDADLQRLELARRQRNGTRLRNRLRALEWEQKPMGSDTAA